MNHKYEVSSVRKALEILCAFTPETSRLAVSDLSRALSIPKSTVHNLLHTLQNLQFLEQDPADRSFALGPKVFELGLLFSRSMTLIRQAFPHMRRLADQTKETVKLAMLTHGEGLVLEAIESPYQLHTRGDIGRRAALHCSSLGKALLASLSDPEITEIVAQRGLARFTNRTITQLSRLQEEVRGIRSSGYALDWEENEEGVCCAAVAIADASGRTSSAVSISGPTSRISEGRLVEFAQMVAETARAISASLNDKVANEPSARRYAEQA